MAQQEKGKAQSATTTCTFTDGKQISVRYQQMPVGAKDKLPIGELWTPDGSPMILFTQTTTLLGGSEIPVGAYSMYLLPAKKDWTLVINKNVEANTKYDEQQDIVRVAMQLGSMSSPAPRVKLIFGHIAAKQCNMRILYAKKGGWAEFKEK
jgi:hypothetical protein